MPQFRRWFPADPRKVGADPDYRFTLANERTFLSWIRTSLAIAAGGLAAISILEDLPNEEFVAIGLLTLSFVTASTAYRRWALNETAMRLEEPLPPSKLPLFITTAIAIGAVISVVFVIATV